MPRRHRSEQTDVSLFPFLAVLVCTMGILVVLLVLAVKAADTQSAQASEQIAQQQAELEELNWQVEAEQLRNESLLEVRPELQSQLSRESAQRSYVQAEIDQLKEAVAARQARMADILPQSAVSAADEEAKIQQLQSVITAAQMLVDSKREKQTNRGKVYSVVPYQGDSGTRRRPIYVECTPDSIILQPFGIRLTPEDFTFPLIPGNPLDESLLAIRQYMERYLARGSAESAYPLLIVRPGGESNFALARRAMLNWDDEFGYELVEVSKQLEFGDADPKLQELVEQTVDRALRQQRDRVALLRSRGQTFEKIGSSVDRAYGGPGQNSAHARAAQSTATQSTGPNPTPTSMAGGGQFQPRGQASASGSPALDSPAPDSPASREANSDMLSAIRSASDSQTSSQQFTPTSGNAAFGTASPTAPEQLDPGHPNWALPSSTANAVAFRRPIVVEAHADRFVIVPGENSNLDPLTVSVSENSSATVQEFVHSIWTVIDSWGIAGANAYWKPVLSIRASAGGESNQEQLKRSLQNSGLEFDQ